MLLVLVGCGSNSNSGNNNTGNPNPGSSNNGGNNSGGNNSGGNSGGNNSGGNNSGGNNSGGGTSTAPQYLYAGSLDKGVQGFRIDGASGALTLLPNSPFGGALEPNSLVADPAQKFLYVGIGQQPAVRGSNCSDTPGELHSFTIDTSGQLAPLEQIKLDAYCVQDVTMDPTGQNLYVFAMKQDGSDALIYGYSVDANTGKLTQLSDSPYTFTGTNVVRAVMSPDGKFIYTVIAGSVNGIMVLGRSSSGTLSQVAVHPFTTDIPVDDIGLVAGGKYLVSTHAQDASTGTVRVWSVDQNSGDITMVHNLSGDKFTGTTNVLADRTGQWVFLSLFAGGINVFKVEADGNLTFTSNAPNSTMTLNMVIDTTNHFVYARNNENSIAGFSFDPSSGKLTPLAGSPFASPSQMLGGVVVKK